MFRKPPLRTYEKKGSKHWHPVSATATILREELPPDKKPEDLEDFNKSDVSLEYDPFDDPFDRLSKEVIEHPIPEDITPDSSSSDSSYALTNDKNRASGSDALIVAPFASPRTVPLSENIHKRPNTKRQRFAEQNTISTPKSTVLGKKRRGRARLKNLSRDENTEPNIDVTAMQNAGGRKISNRRTGLRKKRLTVPTTNRLPTYKGSKREDSDDSRVLKPCTVNLKRLSPPFEKSSIDERKKGRTSFSIAGKPGRINEPEKTVLENVTYKDLNDFPGESSITETSKIDETTDEFSKNLVVSVPKSRISKKFSIRDFSSSTPIGARATKQKSAIRLSPIKSNVDDELDEINELGLASLPPKFVVQAVDSVSAQSASLESNVRTKKNSVIPSTQILSITPDPEPSRLLFDDTELPNEKFVPPNIEISTEIPVSPSIDFGRESSDQESLHLTYDDNEKSPSKNISQILETQHPSPGPSSMLNENDKQTINSSAGDAFMGFSRVRNGDSSEQSVGDNSDDWSTIPGSPNASSVGSVSETPRTIEQLSSGDSTSSDGIAGIASTSRISESDEESVARESSVEEDEKSEIHAMEITSTIVDESIEKDRLEYEGRTFQPVIVLSRLTIDETSNVCRTKDNRNGMMSDTLKSMRESTIHDDTGLSSRSDGSTSKYESLSLSIKSILESPGDDVTLSSTPADGTTSKNESQFALTESEVFYDTEESHIEMESLQVDDYSENMTDMERSLIPKTPEEDLSIYTEELSVEYSSNTSGLLSNNEEPEKSEKLPEDSDNGLEIRAEETITEKVKDVDNSDNDSVAKKDPCPDSIHPVVLLTRLNDPFRITRRRNNYRNWDFKLGAISENHIEQETKAVEDTWENFINESTTDITKETENEAKVESIISNPRVRQSTISQSTNDSCRSSLTANQQNESMRDDKILFLKPGKSWARSLSILSQVHNQEDLESLAVGKGRKWRESVQSLLGMQQQGLVQSCLKKNEDDKELRLFAGLRNSTAWIPGSSQPDTSRLFRDSSPGRFVRRVSIRVVPDCKSFDHIKDTSFLEAYGITQNASKQTIAPRRTFITPRRTLNVVPKSLSSLKSRDVVLAQCGQESSLPFEKCYPDSYLRRCRKIGEGVYGEVFLYENGLEKNVIKIIPIEGEMKINGERQKKFDEILSEIVIAKQLHNLRFADKSNTAGFVEVKNIRCVVGKYPKKLIDLWEFFDEEKSSENDCPSVFEENQLYIVLELGHGGEDLEAYVFQNASEAHALFMQTALALAVAEESLEFEHRDLHWGNLLISRTDDSQIDFKLNDKPISVSSKGVKVSVIDFTLSRMSYQGCSIFNDLAMDEDLFAAQGEYQFDVYRLMRNKLENNWQKFEPFTNVLWLHYILDKMITAVRYRRKNTKIHKNGISKLQELKDEILDYNSAADFVTNCDKVKRLQGSRSSVLSVASSS